MDFKRIGVNNARVFRPGISGTEVDERHVNGFKAINLLLLLHLVTGWEYQKWDINAWVQGMGGHFMLNGLAISMN